MDVESKTYVEAVELFNRGWRHHDKPLPQVYDVVQVVFPEPIFKPYLDYREKVKRALRSRPKLRLERFLFHGTCRACLLGEGSKNARLCSLDECSMCSILRSSFDLSKCGSRNTFKRFGDGIYTTTCSSKADDYVENTSGDAHLRVLIICRVVVGNTFRHYVNAPQYVKPPSGYHSVTGEPGWDLNYQETVCYREDAIRPAFIIVYGDTPKLPVDEQLGSPYELVARP